MPCGSSRSAATSSASGPWSAGRPACASCASRSAAADGGEVGFARASLRFIGLVVAAIPLGLGFLLTLVDDRRQGLQDKIGGTVVLYAAARVRGVVADAVPDPAAARAEAAAGDVIEGTVVPPGARPA